MELQHAFSQGERNYQAKQPARLLLPQRLCRHWLLQKMWWYTVETYQWDASSSKRPRFTIHKQINVIIKAFQAHCNEEQCATDCSST